MESGIKVYYAGCLTFDGNWEPMEITNEPVLAGSRRTTSRPVWTDRGISAVFPCGAVLSGDHWLLSYGYLDEDLRIASFSMSDLDATFGGANVNDYTPKSDKAEWHLTYACDLACPGCNRGCFLPPQTPGMTLADAEEFCRQADELDYHPRIMLIGGEPTLHPLFLDFVRLAHHFNPNGVEVWSNAFRAAARQLLAVVREEGLAEVIEGTAKPRGSVRHPVDDIFLAPIDFGSRREPCGTHACVPDPDCGISVDHEGYTVCCMGGAIDGMLMLGARTKRLADLFDPEFARRQTETLCQYCGQYLGIDEARRAESAMVRGTLMSRTWQTAAERILARGARP